MKDKGLARDLWGFARDSVLEEEVRPRLRNWSQKHIMEHITRCREYRNTYKDKLLGNTNTTCRSTRCVHCKPTDTLTHFGHKIGWPLFL